MTTYEKIIKAGEEIGIQKGEEVAIQKGLQKEKIAVVENCFKEGVSITLAAKISRLSIEEVSAIYSKMSQMS